MSTNVTKENLQEFATKLHAKNKTIFATKTDVGTPLVANTAAGMTDTTKIYVYTGSETGYTAGNWYYYNGSAWASGGVYNAEAIETDTTLTVSGMAADAKAVGDEFAKDLWGVPLAVREAIYTLLSSAAYATTGLTDEITVVENWAEEVYSLTLSADTLSLTGSTPQALVANVVPATASITWSSSDPSIATVNAGVVTGTSNGTCVITATAGDLTATCNATVSGFAELESISAVYTQSGTVYDTDSLDSLKADLVVTAHFDDSSTEVVTAYTLSGTLEVGTSTITVSYGGKTTTFTVEVTDSAALPEGYTKYDYLYSDATANNKGSYINTELTFDLPTSLKCTVDAQMDSTNTWIGAVAGMRKTGTGSTNDNGFYMGYDGSANQYCFIWSNTGSTTSYTPSDLTAKHRLVGTWTPSSLSIAVDDNPAVINNLTTRAIGGYPFCLFGIKHATLAEGGTPYTFRGKIYYAKVEVNGEKVAEFIPCVRDSDSVAGVYDVVRQAFYAPYSQSGRSVVAGNDE